MLIFKSALNALLAAQHKPRGHLIRRSKLVEGGRPWTG